jgi:hypothetical protein
MDAKEIIIVITGAHKALALANCIEQGVNHMYTVSALQMHPHPMIVCDDDATLELKVKTVKVPSEKVALTSSTLKVSNSSRNRYLSQGPGQEPPCPLRE